MTMVALDAPRKKVVPVSSIEARWLVNEGDVAETMKHAKKHPKMQALMEDEAKARVESQEEARKTVALETAAREARLKQLGFA